MTCNWKMPSILTGDIGSAAAVLDEYMMRRLPNGSSPYWTGSMFERFQGGGDPRRVTSDDLVAVTMLGVTFPPRAALRLLGEDSTRVTQLLGDSGIPLDLDLVDAGPAHIGPDSDAWKFWDLVRGYRGVGRTLASKLLARKRPRLLPVQDSIVERVLGHRKTDDYWARLQHHLVCDKGSLSKRLREIRSQSHVGADISDIRVFDILVWMSRH